MNLLEPSIQYTPLQGSNIGLPATYSTIVAFCILTYSLISQSPVDSNVTPTKDHYHSLPSPFLAVTPATRLAILWRNPYTTPSSHPSTPIFFFHIGAPPGLLPYTSYHALWSVTPYPPAHFYHHPYLLRFPQVALNRAQSILLYVIMCPRQGNSMVELSGFRLTYYHCV